MEGPWFEVPLEKILFSGRKTYNNTELSPGVWLGGTISLVELQRSNRESKSVVFKSKQIRIARWSVVYTNDLTPFSNNSPNFPA